MSELKSRLDSLLWVEDYTASTAAPERILSFWEKAVGLSFNPGWDPKVYAIKVHFARLIDAMDELRSSETSWEVKRMCSVAITELQTAQMWAVKALTWLE